LVKGFQVFLVSFFPSRHEATCSYETASCEKTTSSGKETRGRELVLLERLLV